MEKPVSTDDLEQFRTTLQAWLGKAWFAAKNVGEPPVIEVMHGAKYARLVICSGAQRSAYGFVDLTTGNLLKADGWKRPARGVRGNIFAANPLDGCTLYGMVYFAR